jgi:bacterioferritin-associated ferredoxin
MSWPILHKMTVWPVVLCGAAVPLLASLRREAPRVRRIQRIASCCMCDKVRDETKREGEITAWQKFSVYSATHSVRLAEVALIQTFCPDCLKSYRQVLASARPALPCHETITRIESAAS